MSILRARGGNDLSPAGWVVPIALAGGFVAGLSAQFSARHVSVVQAGLHGSGNDASWITTIYIAAHFLAFAASPLLARTFGLRRLFLASTTVFALAAVVSAFAQELPELLVARAAHGLAAGMYGPIAFVSIFRAWNGPRLPFGFALLAVVLLASLNVGPPLAAYIEAAFGWRALFIAQLVMAVPMLLAALRWLPRSPLNRSGHQREWLELGLLASATSSLVVLLSQGPRLDWFASDLVASMAVLSASAWIGFFMARRGSPARVIDASKLLDRRFGIPIALNLVFRIGVAATAGLMPLWRAQADAAHLWILFPQVAAFPLIWRWLEKVDRRIPMALGLLAMAAGILLSGFTTAPALGHALIGIGQVLFLVPALMTGAGSLEPHQGPTGTIVFNMTTVGGAIVGSGLMSAFVDARFAVHASGLCAVERSTWLLALALVLVTPLTALIGGTGGRAAPAVQRTS